MPGFYLPASAAMLPNADNARMSKNSAAANTPPWFHLIYPNGSDRSAWWTCPAYGYTGGTLYIDIFWFAAASSGAVAWQVFLAGVEPGVDDSAIDSLNPGSFGTTTDTIFGSSTNRANLSTISNGSPGISAADLLMIRLMRDGDAGGDTLSVSALVNGIAVRW